MLDNYSQALKQRVTGMKDLAMSQLVGFSGGAPSQETVNNSTIHVYLDMASQQVGLTIKMKLAEASVNSVMFIGCHTKLDFG